MAQIDGISIGLKAAVADALADGHVTDAEFADLQARYTGTGGLQRTAMDAWLSDYPELHAALQVGEGYTNEDTTGLA